MRRVLLCLIFLRVSLLQYGQIIADHTVVDKFNDIPVTYLNEVKKMWLVYAGESHSYGIRLGLDRLEALDSKFAVNVSEGIPIVATSPTPEAYTTSHLRASCGTWGDHDNATGWIYWYGEEDWWSNSTAVSRTEAGITYCNSHNLTVSAMGFGWCWDAMGTGPTENADPVYGVRWWGSSVDGPSGDKAWGINSGQYATTNNLVSMQTYIDVTQGYIDYCTANGIPTKIFFTTGPVDNYNGNFGDECMYQSTLKYQAVRDYVNAHANTILFDYADILCFDENGTATTRTWNGHTYPTITSANLTPGGEAHISAAGELRLGKAMWWMLARMAGWDGSTTGIDDHEKDPASSIIVKMSGGEVRIKIEDSSLNSTVYLYNINGNLIATKKTLNNDCVFNISKLAPGIYIIAVKNANGSATRKIVIS